MIRPLVIIAITIAAFIAALLVTAWSTADACIGRARSILAAADPLDRQPPQTVVDVVRSYVPVERMPDLLASVLLDRYACRGNGIEWLVDRPALAWRLRTSLSSNGMVALFASTANMDKGDIGLSRGARRLYHREIRCLVAMISSASSAERSAKRHSVGHQRKRPMESGFALVTAYRQSREVDDLLR